MARSLLVIANQKRWAQVGELNRDAALLRSLQHRYKNLADSQDITNAIGALEAEAEYIALDYAALREKILTKRKQEKETQDI